MSITELQERKLLHSFNQLDLDANGQVERDDFLGLGARLLVGFAEPPTSAKGKTIIDHFDHLWDTLIRELDLDGDGRISPEEYRDGMARAFIDGPHFENIFRPAVHAVAELCDTDGDGVLTKDEFQSMQSAFGTPAEDIDVAFGKLHTDGSGTLTTAELSEAARTYYVGDDPNAIGNWLFGPVPR